MKYEIIKNKQYGYLEVKNKPSEEDLREYYSQKYYQKNSKKNNKYKSIYSKADIEYINSKISNNFELICQNVDVKKIDSMIDIGCGEGFTLSFFKSKGITPFGVDFSDYGIRNQNPDQISHFRQGNLMTVVNDLIEEKKEFDLLWIDNVLEHVANPVDMLSKCYQLCKTNGHIIIEVPNDYSKYQNFLLKEGLIRRDYWKITPDHLNYFSPDSLTALCQDNGFKLKSQMTEFPIQLFLLNNNSNYYEHPEFGKEAHKSRMLFEKYLKSTCSDGQVISLYQKLLEMGIGRQIIGLYQKQ